MVVLRSSSVSAARAFLKVYAFLKEPCIGEEDAVGCFFFHNLSPL